MKGSENLIKVTVSSEAMDNFRAVLESAFSEYYPCSMSNDLAAITLGKLEENDQNFSINEMIELANSLPQMLNEDAINVTNPHIVHEKKGLGISVTVNGKEYRYVSPDRATPDLFRSFMGMYGHANAGYKALNWLKRNALCYYGAKNPKGQELIEAYEQGRTMIQWNSLAMTPDFIRSMNNTALNEAVTDCIRIDYHPDSLEDCQRVCDLLESERIPYYLFTETTQPSDIPPDTADINLQIKQEEEKLELLKFGRASDKLIEQQKDKIAKLVQRSTLNESVNGASLFNTQKSGMSFYDDFLNPKDHDYKKLCKGLKGTIVMMTPDEYISKLGSAIFHCSRERVLRGVDWDNVDKYADQMRAGTKFDIPILNVAQGTQEGRHRALAAQKLGADKIPILIVQKYDPYKELGMPKSMHLWYGHTLCWTDKQGREHEEHVGLNEEAMKAKVKEVLASGQCKK